MKCKCSAKNTRMFCCIPSSLASCKLASLSGCSDHQSSERAQSFDRMTDTAMTDESTLIYYLCYPKCLAKAAAGKEGRGSKFQAHCHDKVVRPNCIHVYFVRAASILKESKSMRFETHPYIHNC